MLAVGPYARAMIRSKGRGGGGGGGGGLFRSGRAAVDGLGKGITNLGLGLGRLLLLDLLIGWERGV